MKYRYYRIHTKKQRKANGKNKERLEKRIMEAIKNGEIKYAEILYKRGIKRGYDLGSVAKLLQEEAGRGCHRAG